MTEEYPYFGVKCAVGGERSGHGIGLCQEGAAEMARHGSGFREILEHFFPATTMEAVIAMTARAATVADAGLPSRGFTTRALRIA